MRLLRYAFTIAASLVAISPAAAYDWSVIGHVTDVEPSYMPGQIAFSIDAAAGACVAGGALRWFAPGNTEAEKQANAAAVYSTVLSALLAGRNVLLYGDNNNCVVSYIHIR